MADATKTNPFPAGDAGLLEASLEALRRAQLEIQRLRTELGQVALVDEATGLKTRRAFMVLADHHVQLADRTTRPLVLFFADVDGGDPESLACAAGALERSFRVTDVVARFSRDELVVLAPECAPAVVPKLLRRVRASLHELPEKPAHLHLHVGHVVYDPRQERLSVDDLLARADAALYNSRRARLRSAA